MTEDTFLDMFKMFFLQAGYRDVPGSIHMICREVREQIDRKRILILLYYVKDVLANMKLGRYTEVERSQHLTHADKAVFGQSYTADISSCDGMSAFLREKPDNRAVEYFQGLSQFRQEGLPNRLPAALKEDVSRDAELLAWDRKKSQADGNTRKEARQKRQKVLERLEKHRLEEYQRECSSQLARANLFNGQGAINSNAHPLHKLRPEIGRLAEQMVKTSTASQQDRIDAMRDIQSLLASPLIASPDLAPTTSLGLASTAKCSLALLTVCSKDSLKTFTYNDQDKDVQDLAGRRQWTYIRYALAPSMVYRLYSLLRLCPPFMGRTTTLAQQHRKHWPLDMESAGSSSLQRLVSLRMRTQNLRPRRRNAALP
jgi:hypothetical protein